jgi:hypothetical protein
MQILSYVFSFRLVCLIDGASSSIDSNLRLQRMDRWSLDGWLPKILDSVEIVSELWRRESEVQRLTLECSPPAEKDWVSEGCLSLELSSRVYSSPYHSSGSSNTGAEVTIGSNGRRESSQLVF